MTVHSGKWRVMEDGVTVGTESWKSEENSNIIIWSSTIERNTPFQHREELCIRVVPRRWTIKTIEIRSMTDGQNDRFQGKALGSNFEVEIQRDKRLEKLSIPISDSTEFDFLSPIFNSLTFHRLRLRRGQARDIEAVYISPVSREGSFQPRQARQRYTRLKNEDVSVPAGNFPSAKHYSSKNLDSGWTASIWTDNLETVLRYETLYELLSYHHSS